MSRLRLLWLVSLTLALATVSFAQDVPTDSFINRDVPVDDSITSVAHFDLWRFSAAQGEAYRLTMVARDGLIPLVGVRDATGDVFAVSDRFEDGTTLPARPNGEAIVVFEVPADGELVVIASRDGLELGTTVGRYTLTLTQISGPPENDGELPVDLPCGESTVRTQFAIQFGDTTETGILSGRVMTWDGNAPALTFGGGECHQAQETIAARISLSGDAAQDVTASIASAIRSETLPPGPIRALIATERDGDSVLLRLEGFQIEFAGDVDLFTISVPASAEFLATVWAVAETPSRLDLVVIPESDRESLDCADVGLRFCANPALYESLITTDTSSWLQPRRLDSAFQARTDPQSPLDFSVQAQNLTASGSYALLILFQPANP